MKRQQKKKPQKKKDLQFKDHLIIAVQGLR